ncbi:MAG: hypothetical protein ACRDYU_06860 [Actinomycetes bacterium]
MLVVDAANVVGSRPDGWWRDRGAAARRLLKALTEGGFDDTDVVLVVEGAACRGVQPGTVDGVLVVLAPGSGDDEIVDVVSRAMDRTNGERPVTVVTADRGLRQRVASLGGATVGPRWLWDRLERGRQGGGVD